MPWMPAFAGMTTHQSFPNYARILSYVRAAHRQAHRSCASLQAKKTPRSGGVKNAFQRRRSRCCRAMKRSLRWALIVHNPYRTHVTAVPGWLTACCRKALGIPDNPAKLFTNYLLYIVFIPTAGARAIPGHWYRAPSGHGTLTDCNDLWRPA